MIFEITHRVGVEDVRINNEATDRALLEMLENIACLHADSVGFGILNVDLKRCVWILLDWKIKVLKRPAYGELLKIRTWSRDYEKLTAYRDFEVINEADEKVLIGTSKWILMNADTWRPMRVTGEYIDSYKPEVARRVFENEIPDIEEPESFETEKAYTVLRRDIDLNNHMHNLNYLDIAYEALPEEEYAKGEFDNVIITYKKEIKYGAVVKVCYAKVNEKNIIVLKTEDEVALSEKTNAIIALF